MNWLTRNTKALDFIAWKMGSLCLFYVIKLPSAWVYWQSALLVQQAWMTSHHKRQKNYGSHTITLAMLWDHMDVDLFLPETDCTCVKWWYLQAFFHFFKILIFWVKGQKGGKRTKNSPKWKIKMTSCMVSQEQCSIW